MQEDSVELISALFPLQESQGWGWGGHYKSVGKGVGDSCSLGAYLAKKGKKTVSMTPTMANM